MKAKTFLFGLLILPFAAASCVNENTDDCDTYVGGRVVVGVQDKNYDNVDLFTRAALVDPLDENLPLSSYVTSLYTWDNTGTQYKSFQESMSRTATTHTLNPAIFVDGVNNVAVIGNETTAAANYSSSNQSIALHPGGVEYNDVYVGAKQITFPTDDDHSIMLQRTKGMLIVDFNPDNVPTDLKSIAVSIDNVYASVTPALVYSGTTTVSKSVDMTTTGFVPVRMVVAPTVTGGQSTLTITITSTDNSTSVIEDISTTIERNHITALLQEWDAVTGGWAIKQLLGDGTWSTIKTLDLI